jgi:hypothetical protein
MLAMNKFLISLLCVFFLFSCATREVVKVVVKDSFLVSYKEEDVGEGALKSPNKDFHFQEVSISDMDELKSCFKDVKKLASSISWLGPFYDSSHIYYLEIHYSDGSIDKGVYGNGRGVMTIGKNFFHISQKDRFEKLLYTTTGGEISGVLKLKPVPFIQKLDSSKLL